jgi:hypothetical protein
MKSLYSILSGIVILAAAVNAAQLDPGDGTRSGNRTNELANEQTWNGLKELMAEADNILTANERSAMTNDDGTYYYYANGDGGTWVWTTAVFRTDDPDRDFTVYWEAYTANRDAYGVEVHLWNPAPYAQGGERFNLKDIGPTGSWTTARTFSVKGIKWFHWDDEEDTYKGWVLLEGYTAPYLRYMKVDCCKFGY